MPFRGVIRKPDTYLLYVNRDKNMEYIGKYGEHYALLNLLQRDIESYMAVKATQDAYDITVVLSQSCVKRVQVKATELQNKNTNNSISGTEKKFDYLVLVVVDNDIPRAFILTKEEAYKERRISKKFSVSCKENGSFKVKNSLLKYENQWEKIEIV
jgi:hypothetical protein